MKTRILTGVVSAIAFIVILLLPPMVFTVALGIVGLIMLYECYMATKATGKEKGVGYFCAILLMISAYGIVKLKNTTYFPWDVVFVCAVVFTVLSHMIIVVKEHGNRTYADVLSNGFLTVYIVMSVISIFVIKESFGTLSMLVLFICAWGTDTFAYFGGRFFGKHKLIEHVSPKKTVEGAIIGGIGAMVLCALYMFYINSMQTALLLNGAIIGVIGSVFSQIGDLSASAIKRDAGIKDFGTIFPGHGGFLDRFDSVIYIAPLVCLLLHM